MRTIVFAFVLIVSAYNNIIAQIANWKLELEPVSIEGLPGVQSYAYGTIDGYWIVIGGRLDGLHQRQPFASFDPIDNNTRIVLINPNNEEFWTASITGLETRLKEQMQSSNMQFQQIGKYLYLTGGYGYSDLEDEHITYPYITRIDLEYLSDAILDSKNIEAAFVQKECDACAVAGGRMEMMGDSIFLVGGHYFYGRYNPHGPDHGPGFTQVYTGEARILTIQSDDNDFNFNFEEPFRDEMHLRKRDYNLIPQIRDGKEMLVAFSGVFQRHVDLPYLYPVEIYQDHIEPIESFSQYLNHYHCANIPIYDGVNEKMHNLFFGGIAQFYYEDGVMVQDNNVPFVKTITDVSYSENQGWQETKLNFEMPDYFGAGSEFILEEGVAQYESGVIKLNELNDKQIIGYIYGGIRSNMPNIFWINNGSQSVAAPTVFKVRLTKNLTSSSNDMIIKEPYLVVVPNPNNGKFRLIYKSDVPENVQISINDLTGKQFYNNAKQQVNEGKNILDIDMPGLSTGTYMLSLKSENYQVIRKVIVDN